MYKKQLLSFAITFILWLNISAFYLECVESEDGSQQTHPVLARMVTRESMEGYN